MCGVPFSVAVVVLALLLEATSQEVQDVILPIDESGHSPEETARLAALEAELEEQLRLEAGGYGEGAIPGEAEHDYPVYTRVPRTSFSCGDKRFPGYYVDVEARCQAFHICESGGAQHSFLCPSGSIFSQKFQVCDWWYSSDCPDTDPDSLRLYHLNNQEEFSINEAANQDLAQDNNYVFLPNDIFHGAETGVPNRDKLENYKLNSTSKNQAGEDKNVYNNQQESVNMYSQQNIERNSNNQYTRRGVEKKQNERPTQGSTGGTSHSYRGISGTSSSTTISYYDDENLKLK